jgi:hypothetical protein
MRAQTIGRVLGTGVRVAGRLANERLSGRRGGQLFQTQSSGAPVTPASSSGSGRRSGRCWRHCFSRSNGRFLSTLCGGLWPDGLAPARQLCRRTRPREVSGRDCAFACLCLSQREFVLARAETLSVIQVVYAELRPERVIAHTKTPIAMAKRSTNAKPPPP